MSNVTRQYCRPNTIQTLLDQARHVDTIWSKVLDRSSHTTEGERVHMDEDTAISTSMLLTRL
jgi:hypothetical protein